MGIKVTGAYLNDSKTQSFSTLNMAFTSFYYFSRTLHTYLHTYEKQQ